MGKLLITPEERDNQARGCNTAVCGVLMAVANSSKNAVLAFRKPLFYPLNYRNDDLERISGLNGDGQGAVPVRTGFWRRPSRSTIGRLLESILVTGVST